MSLKSEYGEAGYLVFDTWSQGSDKYNINDCKSTWRSINGTGGVGIGTLFMMAKEGGYKPKQNGAHKPFKAAIGAPKPSPANESTELIKSCEITQKFWAESVSGVPHEYADRKGVDDAKWNVTTGDKKHIYALARKSYFAVLDEGDGGIQDFIHTENFVLVDAKRQIRGYYDGTDSEEIDRLILDIIVLQEEALKK